jgi:hypothetical protein
METIGLKCIRTLMPLCACFSVIDAATWMARQTDMYTTMYNWAWVYISPSSLYWIDKIALTRHVTQQPKFAHDFFFKEFTSARMEGQKLKTGFYDTTVTLDFGLVVSLTWDDPSHLKKSHERSVEEVTGIQAHSL